MGYARTGWLKEEWDTLSRCLMGIASTHSCGDLNIGGDRLCSAHACPKTRLHNKHIPHHIGTFFVVVVVFDVYDNGRVVYSTLKVNVFVTTYARVPHDSVSAMGTLHWS
jgi:hypothetical protein